ncbi:nucleoside phosphorylase domain-containing protein [Aspergillus navahoensis]
MHKTKDDKSPNDYTVGLICPLPIEHIAATACLDVEHDNVSVNASAADNNDYVLGRIGEHNVVIACCFPNVRVGLLVGIGGGVPTKHDIWLGDVVVSVPQNGMSGVFQYDYGKGDSRPNFRSNQRPQQTPPALLTAVSGLEGKYKRKGHRIEDTLNAILAKQPRLRQEYCRPVSASDRLFKSDITHDERTQLEDNPTIHYGIIASGKQLIKDATIRYKLAAERDVLCFEMEAAGLMKPFPCLVIRGISDYSDSYKNKHWQRYAALTAALYAKDLLNHVSAGKINAEKRILDLLSDG